MIDILLETQRSDIISTCHEKHRRETIQWIAVSVVITSLVIACVLLALVLVHVQATMDQITESNYQCVQQDTINPSKQGDTP